MKDNYIRFRCTEAEKTTIEALAKAQGYSMSEYILSLVKEDSKFFHESEFQVIVYRDGKEIGRKSLGFFLLDDQDRADKYTTGKELTDLAEEYYSTFKKHTSQSYRIESNGRKMTTTPMADYIWLEK